jgi:hypothetical protein
MRAIKNNLTTFLVRELRVAIVRKLKRRKKRSNRKHNNKLLMMKMQPKTIFNKKNKNKNLRRMVMSNHNKKVN